MNQTRSVSVLKFPPSFVIVFTFLYILALRKKFDVEPKCVFKSRSSKFLNHSPNEKHLQVNLDTGYSLSLFAKKSEIAVCIWDSNDQLVINEGVHYRVPLCKDKIKVNKEEIRREYFCNCPYSFASFEFKLMEKVINDVREYASNFLTSHVCEAHFLLNEQSLKAFLEELPEKFDKFQKDSKQSVNMFNYFNIHLLNYLQESFIF